MGDGFALWRALTSDERARLRELVDRMRRERAELEARIEMERLPRVCAHCGAPIPPERVGNPANPARYCKPTHRQYAYYRRKRGLVPA